MVKRVFAVLTAGVVAACTPAAPDPFNPSPGMHFLEDRARPVSILVIGNSIAYHPPLPELGWTGNWGIASSSAETAFPQIIAAGLDANLQIVNVAEWERAPSAYNYAGLTDIVKPADVVFVKLGENVPAGGPAFEAALEKLIDAANPKGRVFIGSTYWTRGRFPSKGWWTGRRFDQINASMKAVAKRRGWTFVVIPKGGAATTFAHPGMAAHPGDDGMAKIADAFLKASR